MKRLFVALLAILALSACRSSSDDTDTPAPAPAAKPINIRVYNSAWKIVKAETLVANRISADITSADAIKAEVEAYNAAHTDDQWFIENGEQEIPIDQAPDAPAWIVNSATLAIYWQGTVSRSDLETRREVWRASVGAFDDPDTHKNVACTLYVDRLPPDPPVIVPPAPLLWTALLDTSAKVVYFSEHHDTEDESRLRYLAMTAQALANNTDEAAGSGNIGDRWQPYIGATEYVY